MAGFGIREAVLVDEFHRLVADLRIGLVGIHGLGLCRRDAGIFRSRIDGRGDIGELGPDAGLHVVEIDIAHNGDSLQIRTIPLMIEVQDLLALETVDYLERTDYGAVGVLGTLIDEVGLAAHHPVAGFVAQAPLFADDAALCIQIGLFAGDVARPVVQDHQDRIHEAFAGQGYGRDIIHRLMPAGVSVHVVAEAHAVFGQEIQQVLAGVVSRAVEGHVLQKMGQAVLVVLFLQRAHVVDDVELRYAGRILIVIEVIGHPVVQAANAESGIVGDILGGGAEAQECQRKGEEESFHNDQNVQPTVRVAALRIRPSRYCGVVSIRVKPSCRRTKAENFSEKIRV